MREQRGYRDVVAHIRCTIALCVVCRSPSHARCRFLFAYKMHIQSHLYIVCISTLSQQSHVVQLSLCTVQGSLNKINNVNDARNTVQQLCKWSRCSWSLIAWRSNGLGYCARSNPQKPNAGHFRGRIGGGC